MFSGLFKVREGRPHLSDDVSVAARVLLLQKEPVVWGPLRGLTRLLGQVGLAEVAAGAASQGHSEGRVTLDGEPAPAHHHAPDVAQSADIAARVSFDHDQ